MNLKKYSILLLLLLLCQTIAYSQSYKPSFIEKFEYDNLDNFVNQTSSYPNPSTENDTFIFSQLKSQDMAFDDNNTIDDNEKIKEPLIVTSPTDSNNNVLQVRLKQNNIDLSGICYDNSTEEDERKCNNDKNYLRRSELVRSAMYSHSRIREGDEFWWGFKVYLEQFNPDLDSCYIQEGQIDILNQVLIGDWQLDSLGDLAKGPVFDILIHKNKFYVNFTNYTSGEKKRKPIGNIETKKWINFLVHFKISKENDAFIEVWKDNIRVFDEYNFQNSPKNDIHTNPIQNRLQYDFKFGLYKPHINSCASSTTMEYNNPSTDRILLFDDVWLDNNYSTKPVMDGISLIPEECGTEKTVTINDPTINLMDIPGDNTYTILLRKEADENEPVEDKYFSSNKTSLNLLEILPRNLKSNREYSITARIDGHSLYNEYSTNACSFTTSDLSLRLKTNDCNKTVTYLDPTISFVDVPRDKGFTVLLRKEAFGNEPIEDVYFGINNATINLLNLNPSNLKSHRTYTVTARIDGHPLYNQYSTNVCSFTTGNLNFTDSKNSSSIINKTPISIYPNPVFTDETISFDKKASFLVIYDLDGRLKYQSNNPKGSLNLNKLNLRGGLYFFKTNLFSKQVLIIE